MRRSRPQPRARRPSGFPKGHTLSDEDDEERPGDQGLRVTLPRKEEGRQEFRKWGQPKAMKEALAGEWPQEPRAGSGPQGEPSSFLEEEGVGRK